VEDIGLVARCEDCPNHALVTVDTNVLCYLARFCYVRGGLTTGRAPGEVIAELSSRFGDLIDSFCDCSPDRKLLTSDVALSREQSVEHSQSHLRQELYGCDPSLRGAQDADWQPMSDVLAPRLAADHLDAGAAKRFAKRYSCEGRVDASLLVTALVNAQRGRCVLLTFDQDLIDAVWRVKACGAVDWGGRSLPTADLSPQYPLSFVTGQHQRCCRGQQQTLGMLVERMKYDLERAETMSEPKRLEVRRVHQECLEALWRCWEAKAARLQAGVAG